MSDRGMNDLIAEADRTAEGNTLFVDDIGNKPWFTSSDLWAASLPPSFKLIVAGAPRTARDLFRVLVGADHLLLEGGVILLLPYASPDGAVENRFEATEVFIGAYPDYERRPLAFGIVELRKVRKSQSAKKRVISLAVFGAGGYWDHLGSYIRAHHTLFPGYELRIYHDENIDVVPYGKALKNLATRGLVTLVRMFSYQGMGKCQKMLWRLAPAWDPTVEYVFSRDLDALPTWKERCATEEFIASGLQAHTIHANTSHAGLMGGLCGFRAEALNALYPTFDDFVAAAGYSDAEWAVHGADQNLLNQKIAERLKIFEHSVFDWFEADGVTRRYRSSSKWGSGGLLSAKFATSIAAFDDPRVAESVRGPSDALIPYMGVAGADHIRATEFFDGVCPVIDQIKAAEQ